MYCLQRLTVSMPMGCRCVKYLFPTLPQCTAGIDAAVQTVPASCRCKILSGYASDYLGCSETPASASCGSTLQRRREWRLKTNKQADRKSEGIEPETRGTADLLQRRQLQPCSFGPQPLPLPLPLNLILENIQPQFTLCRKKRVSLVAKNCHFT